jgi:predicted transcriptional regulator of viral defense system
MNFALFRREVTSEVFDYLLLTSYLKEFKKPRDKVNSLIAEGKIVRIKNGLYIFGEDWRRAPLNLETIANVIYGPSCISFEYALSHYGLIAERSQVITSVVIGDTKTFKTPIGQFEYQAIPKEKFKIGINYENLKEGGGYFIASKEKALVDLVYKTKGIRTLEQLRHYLFEEMRVDETMFRDLDFEELEKIAKAYNKNSVTMLIKL